MDIRNNTALVTGGASGLGAATVRMLHGRGANVVICDVNEDNGNALAKELGERAVFARTDVTSGEDVSNAVQQATSRFGGLHLTVCCAGIGTPAKVIGREGPMALEQFSQVININLIGTFNTIRLAGEAMMQHDPDGGGERGVIVCTASVAAYEGQIGQAAYSASKGGVASMTVPVAREFARHGIRVMTIAPGLFDTPMMAGLPEEARESLGKQVPFPSRLGRPDEYAALCESIIGNSMLNGETIRLDGAIRMQPR